MTRRRIPRRVDQPAPAATDERFFSSGLLIFLVALALRLFHVWQIQRAPFASVLMGDSRAYDEWAQRIAAGDWLGREVFYQAPLYPYFLGIIYTLAGHHLIVVRLSHAFLGASTCLLIGLTARRLFTKEIGLVAGLCLALYAPAIFFEGLVQKSALDVFFTSLALWMVSGLIAEPGHRGTWLTLGIVLGALSLTRENALVFVAVVVGWAVARVGLSWRQRFYAAAVLVAGVSIVLVPVAVRNNLVGGGFYLTTSQFGPNLFIGNNSNANGSYMSLRFGRGAPEFEQRDATELAEQAAGRTLTPAEVSSYWTDRALDFILDHPGQWLSLLTRKLGLLLNRTEAVDTESQEMYAEWSTPIKYGAWIGHFGVLVPLAVLGLCVTWARRPTLWIFYALMIAYAASVTLFYVFARYRFPLVPLLVLFAAPGLVATWHFLRDRRWPDLRVLAAVAMTVLVCNWPLLSAATNRAVSETNLATALQEDGRLDEAVDHFRRAIAARADYAPAFNNMGVALQAKGELAHAIETYQQAIALHPEFPDAHYNLAIALMDQHQPERAAEHLRLALRSVPGSVEAHTNLGIALAAQGQSAEALAEFRKAVQVDPNSAKAQRNLGDALAAQGNAKEAIEHFRRAVQLAPDNGANRYDLGSLLLDSGRVAEAIEEFRASLAQMPNSVEAHNNLGIALASNGRLDEAIEQFRLSLALKPDFAEAQRNLTMALAVRRQGGRPSLEGKH